MLKGLLVKYILTHTNKYGYIGIDLVCIGKSLPASTCLKPDFNLLIKPVIQFPISGPKQVEEKSSCIFYINIWKKYKCKIIKKNLIKIKFFFCFLLDHSTNGIWKKKRSDL